MSRFQGARMFTNSILQTSGASRGDGSVKKGNHGFVGKSFKNYSIVPHFLNFLLSSSSYICFKHLRTLLIGTHYKYDIYYEYFELADQECVTLFGGLEKPPKRLGDTHGHKSI